MITTHRFYQIRRRRKLAKMRLKHSKGNMRLAELERQQHNLLSNIMYMKRKIARMDND